VFASAESSFDGLLVRMEASGVVHSRRTLKGCSETEIMTLRSLTGVEIPWSYRRFLKLMGHGTGKLFRTDHIDVLYPAVLNLNRERSTLLPGDALLISNRLGDDHDFICCDGTPDPPVMQWAVPEQTIVQSHASVLDWLESWCADAESAIKSGYFKGNPKGTRSR
jgi:hypothetical protein